MTERANAKSFLIEVTTSEDFDETFNAETGTSMFVIPYVNHDSTCASSYSVVPLRLDNGFNEANIFIRLVEVPPNEVEGEAIVRASPLEAKGVILVRSSGLGTVSMERSDCVFAATAST